MDTTFISVLLFISILAILGLYLYQGTPALHSNKSKNNATSKKAESFFPVIFDTCPRNRMTGMPVHRVGPVHNFHQKFNKYSSAITCSRNPASIPEVATQCKMAFPTGIPEMGWRNWYLERYSKNQVPEEDSFAGTSVRNFLNNMENVDNIYRKCE
jgi:hypothetical protein